MDERRAQALHGLSGTGLGSRLVSYDERDAILYAIAVCAPSTDLDLVYERNLRVIPTYAMALGLWAVEEAGALGAYDATRSLHVGQRLSILRRLPSNGRIEMDGAIGGVWDKGSAALVQVSVRSEYFTADYDIYAVGAGGFGGERGPSTSDATHHGTPEFSVIQPTRDDQAALYRLTGDLHPVHIDPVVARASGFERPILHGLCTLGIAARAIATASGSHPAELSSLTARFTAPVLPGTPLEIHGWRSGDVRSFVVLDDGSTTILRGSVEFAGVQ